MSDLTAAITDELATVRGVCDDLAELLTTEPEPGVHALARALLQVNGALNMLQSIRALLEAPPCGNGNCWPSNGANGKR